METLNTPADLHRDIQPLSSYPPPLPAYTSVHYYSGGRIYRSAGGNQVTLCGRRIDPHAQDNGFGFVPQEDNLIGESPVNPKSDGAEEGVFVLFASLRLHVTLYSVACCSFLVATYTTKCAVKSTRGQLLPEKFLTRFPSTPLRLPEKR